MSNDINNKLDMNLRIDKAMESRLLGAAHGLTKERVHLVFADNDSDFDRALKWYELDQEKLVKYESKWPELIASFRAKNGLIVLMRRDLDCVNFSYVEIMEGAFNFAHRQCDRRRGETGDRTITIRDVMGEDYGHLIDSITDRGLVLFYMLDQAINGNTGKNDLKSRSNNDAMNDGTFHRIIKLGLHLPA